MINVQVLISFPNKAYSCHKFCCCIDPEATPERLPDLNCVFWYVSHLKPIESQKWTWAPDKAPYLIGKSDRWTQLSSLQRQLLTNVFLFYWFCVVLFFIFFLLGKLSSRSEKHSNIFSKRGGKQRERMRRENSRCN